jgi:single-strand DNA-binding protein
MGAPTVCAIGNLGSDPESKYLGTGQMLTTFNLATNDVRKGANGEKVNKTIWFKVTVWGKRGEAVAQYLSKGSSVYVTGALSVNEFTDKAGQLRQAFEINASDFTFIGSKNNDSNGGGQQRQAPAPARPKQDASFFGDDLDTSDAGDVPF